MIGSWGVIGEISERRQSVGGGVTRQKKEEKRQGGKARQKNADYREKKDEAAKVPPTGRSPPKQLSEHRKNITWIAVSFQTNTRTVFTKVKRKKGRESTSPDG